MAWQLLLPFSSTTGAIFPPVFNFELLSWALCCCPTRGFDQIPVRLGEFSCAQAGGKMYVYGLEVRGLELFLGLGLLVGLGFFGVWGFGVGVMVK
jgi:hypothetical protein